MNKFRAIFFVTIVVVVAVFFVTQFTENMVFEAIQIVGTENNSQIKEQRSYYESVKHLLPITFKFHIGPKKSNCRGIFGKRCLVDKGENFYGTIDGFKYRSGYYYELEVEVSDAGSTLQYTLLQELKKIPEDKISPQDSCFYNYGLFYLDSGECGIE